MRREVTGKSEENELDDSMISQFRAYLNEMRKIQTLAVSLPLSWWDK